MSTRQIRIILRTLGGGVVAWDGNATVRMWGAVGR